VKEKKNKGSFNNVMSRVASIDSNVMSRVAALNKVDPVSNPFSVRAGLRPVRMGLCTEERAGRTEA